MGAGYGQEGHHSLQEGQEDGHHKKSHLDDNEGESLKDDEAESLVDEPGGELQSLEAMQQSLEANCPTLENADIEDSEKSKWPPPEVRKSSNSCSRLRLALFFQ